MLKANKKTIIITSLVILMPAAAGLMLWDRLPDPMATHFGMSGEADGFSSKAFGVFGLPLILLGVHLLCIVATCYDPRRQNISPKLFSLVLWVTPLISAIASAMVYAANLGYKTNSQLYAGLIIGFVFVIVGNYLPKTRQNYTIGIKLPWTLANEENWNKTHRLAGALWVAAGVIILAAALSGHLRFDLMFALIIAATIIPSGYSFKLHARKGL